MSATHAAHIVTADAHLGDPEIIVMTQTDEYGVGAEEVERFVTPERLSDLPYDLTAAVGELYERGWRAIGEATATDHDGYWIVPVKRVSD